MAPRIARSPSLRMLLLPLALTAACLPMAAYAADASTDQVYAAAKAGDVPGALTMMDQVLKDHPNSAKAHYVEAELLSRAHRAADARVELAKAQQLDPSGRFANARSQAQLRAAQGAGGGAAGAVAPAPAPQGSHISFGMILFGALAIFGILAFLRRRSANQYPPAMGQGGYPAGYGPGYGPQGGPMGGYGGGMGGGMMGGGMGGGMGSGLMGGLATGVGMGAGLAVGEEVVGRMFGDHERRPEGGMGGGWDQNADPNADMGGNDFGVSGGGWDDGGSGGGGDGGW